MHKQLLIYLITIEIIFSFNIKKDCNLLPDGFYKLEYTTNSNEKTSMIKIDNEKFYQYKQNGDKVKGKIDWIYNCSFIFNYDVKK
jgi:hypothetical protein